MNLLYIYIWKCTARMWIAVLYNNKKNWEQPNFPPVVDLFNLFCYIHTMERDAATKKNEVAKYMHMRRLQELLGGKMIDHPPLCHGSPHSQGSTSQSALTDTAGSVTWSKRALYTLQKHDRRQCFGLPRPYRFFKDKQLEPIMSSLSERKCPLLPTNWSSSFSGAVLPHCHKETLKCSVSIPEHSLPCPPSPHSLSLAKEESLQ